MIAMNKEGRTFKGCLYFGLMLTEDGPKVIEYNCRFGDPEAQVVLPLLDSDLLDIMKHVHDGTLEDADVRFARDEATCCVVMATEGYPGKYGKGYDIYIPDEIKDHVYVAGADLAEDGHLLSNGGRVLGVTERGKDIREAIQKAYESVDKIRFDHGFYRHDIGQRALNNSRPILPFGPLALGPHSVVLSLHFASGSCSLRTRVAEALRQYQPAIYRKAILWFIEYMLKRRISSTVRRRL